ncbi:MAG TPA: epoxyqueuosine reductase QueH [Euryarchaeota archaeon]|nr:epoxyqueuosine reductase QueH [Euryarchaeota archaeon]
MKEPDVSTNLQEILLASNNPVNGMAPSGTHSIKALCDETPRTPGSSLLIHSCCAPCFVSAKDYFSNYEVEGLFFNPFIHPFREYKKRFQSMMELEKRGETVHFVDEYDLKGFLKVVLEMEEKGVKRCSHCYSVRLKRTADIALMRGFDAFATTLVVSPYQDILLINEIGESEGNRAGIKYLSADLRHLHDEGHKRAKDMNLYMQGYCGCIFSEEERYKKPLKKTGLDHSI